MLESALAISCRDKVGTGLLIARHRNKASLNNLLAVIDMLSEARMKDRIPETARLGKKERQLMEELEDLLAEDVRVRTRVLFDHGLVPPSALHPFCSITLVAPSPAIPRKHERLQRSVTPTR